MRVTEKGQVTIPKEIRDRMGISPGSEVEFVVDERGAMLVRTDTSVNEEDISDFDDWLKRVKGSIDLDGMTTDAYMDWLRGSRDDLDPR